MRELKFARVMGALIVAVVIGSGCAASDESPGDDDDLGTADGHGGVARTAVCFTVNVPGNATPQTVRGDLFHSPRRLPGRTTVLLQHGAVTDKTIWNPDPSLGVPSVARELAREGYGAVAIDRLGYHTSPYVGGSGFDLTAEAYVSMTNEIVQQLHDGTFLVTKSTCEAGAPAGRGAEHVVLAGHSAGAGETMAYATRFHDIDGIIAANFATDPREPPILQQLFGVLGPQLGAGQDFVRFFVDAEEGENSPFCEDFAFHPPGTDDDVLDFACGEYLVDASATSPAGEVTTIAALMADARANLGNVGPTPALLVWGDEDSVFPGPRNPEDGPDIQTAEFEFWRANCNCDVESFTARRTGHTVTLHRKADSVIDRMLDFLDDLDL